MLRPLVALLLWLAPALASAQVIGLTFDDGFDPTRNPKAELLNTRILHALEQQQLHAIIFPALDLIGGERGMALIEQWAAAGHGVGNHTASHRSLGSPKVSLSSFIADVQRADEALQYALAQDVLDCFTIGAENRGELADLVNRIPPASVRA